MTSAILDTQKPLPDLSRPRDVLITWAADIAAKSRAEVFARWLRVAFAKHVAQVEIDTALQHARECAGDFADFAILAGRDPELFAAVCAAEFGREIDVARAMIRAEVVARPARPQTAKVPA